ncbi:MAG: M28 family peptidase [Chitinophagaceae bacterium]
MYRTSLLFFSFLLGWFIVPAQLPDTAIREAEAARIMGVLASDSLKGRGNLQPAQWKAAAFISEEFRKYRLRPLPGQHGYFIPFQPFGGPWLVTDSLHWNGRPVHGDYFLYLPAGPGAYAPKTMADFAVVRVDSFPADLLQQGWPSGTNLLLWTPKRAEERQNQFPEFRGRSTALSQNILLVYADEAPAALRLEAQPDYSRLAWNIVGVLPGRSRATEVVLFSAHYDHMGVVKDRGRDSIMNGANDNASGTTGLLLLADYFARRGDNERTLIFCAFAGEELGMTGSAKLVDYLSTDRIMAGINLEMIGVPQYGKKKVFITGEKYSSLPGMLRKGLTKAGIRVMTEPDENKQLFLRSDNYPFVKQEVPVHTIMASDDDDPCYHRPCDEVKRIDIANLTAIARAVAAAAAGLISGHDTPGRVRTADLPY